MMNTLAAKRRFLCLVKLKAVVSPRTLGILQPDKVIYLERGVTKPANSRYLDV